MTELNYSQYAANRAAHQQASLVNMVITYKEKEYSYKEFEEAFPIEDVKLYDASVLRRRNKKRKS